MLLHSGDWYNHTQPIATLSFSIQIGIFRYYELNRYWSLPHNKRTLK